MNRIKKFIIAAFAATAVLCATACSSDADNSDNKGSQNGTTGGNIATTLQTT